jgi:hypothetical protein
LNAAVVRAFERADQQPVAGCFDFVRAAAARLEPGFALPETLVREHEPTEVWLGYQDGSHDYRSSFRAGEGDAGRAVTLEVTYVRPEEMHPEPHEYMWVYTVHGLSAGRRLVLTCWCDTVVGEAKKAGARIEVAGSKDECAAVLAQFHTRFTGMAEDITAES